ncbi:hypothetical protein CsSME_00023924 [Camellia sinensis var. sinensis]
MKTFKLGAFFLILLVFLITHCLEAEARNDSNCCIDGKPYPIYKCLPAISNKIKAILTLNTFQEGGGPRRQHGKPWACLVITMVYLCRYV